MRCRRNIWTGLGFIVLLAGGCTATRPPEAVIEPVFSFTNNQPTPNHLEQFYPLDTHPEMAQSSLSPKASVVSQ